MKIRALLLAFSCLTFGVVPAAAQTDLYDDGPTNGTINAWTINYGFIQSDSFVLSSPSTVNGLIFAAWMEPGDTLLSAQLSITSNENGGTTYFDQVVNFAQSGCVLNQYGYNVCNETGSFAGVAMNAGTYWLNLQNAVSAQGNPVYWDENTGPSSASNNSVGTMPGESFTILGTASSTSTTSTTSTTPEPGSIVLLGSAILGLAGVLRRKIL